MNPNFPENSPMKHAGMAADDDLQRQYFEMGKIYRLQIESTLSCPQLCDFCYADSKPESSHGLSTQKIHEILESAAAMDIKVIDWLGGDPLVRPDWYELAKYANELGLVNNIWTSGLPLANPKVAEKLVEVTQNGFISVHLDSIHPEFYALVHGDGGKNTDLHNIDRILKGVQNCIRFGKLPEAMVNCITFTKPLANGDAKQTIQYFYQKYGIKTCLTLFKPVTLQSKEHDWQPSPDQIKDTYTFRDTLYPDDPSVGAMDVSKYYCGSMVCVTAMGWLVPCSVIRTQEFGNVNDIPLPTLVDKHRQRILFMDFRDPSKMPGKCGKCKSNTVCFGCRSNAYYYSGDVCAADPMCQAFCPKSEQVGF